MQELMQLREAVDEEDSTVAVYETAVSTLEFQIDELLACGLDLEEQKEQRLIELANLQREELNIDSNPFEVADVVENDSFFGLEQSPIRTALVSRVPLDVGQTRDTFELIRQ